jgi:hypothetical protein
MKKIFVLVLMCALICSTASAAVYPAVGVVFELDRENDLVVFEDCTGNLWAMEGIEDWMVGDIGALLMNDMETNTIYDDEIVMVRYAGQMPEETH